MTLALAEAPESFALAFKQGLQGVGEAISKSIVTAMSQDVTNGHLNAQVGWGEVLHWMWPLFTERWAAWRSDRLHLSPCPLTVCPLKTECFLNFYFLAVLSLHNSLDIEEIMSC
jgi:hypothetical protein